MHSPRLHDKHVAPQQQHALQGAGAHRNKPTDSNSRGRQHSLNCSLQVYTLEAHQQQLEDPCKTSNIYNSSSTSTSSKPMLHLLNSPKAFSSACVKGQEVYMETS
jgi:hypothetical protein